MNLSIAAFTQGETVPSARFRVRQLIKPLAKQGVTLQEYPSVVGSYPPADTLSRIGWAPRVLWERASAVRSARSHQVALFQREMVSTLATVERLWDKPAVLDLDDAVWLKQRFHSIDRLARWAENIICGNAFIAEHFAGASRTWVLPTAVDTDRFVPLAHSRQEPTLVWSGSSSGLPYLYDLLPALHRVMNELPAVRLRIVSDVVPALPGLSGERIEFVRWSPDVEVSALQSASVGLMPMPDTPWTRGKCSFKMLTYMACGLPVVVSPWGMNAEVLGLGTVGFGARTLDEWTSALLQLLREPDQARAAGRTGCKIVAEHYSVAKIVPQLVQILKSVAES